jgi:hypothetical protein
MGDQNTVVLPQDTPDFDEDRFLRSIKRRSLVRTVIIALITILVVVAVAIVGGIVWRNTMYEQSWRIDNYYRRLTWISSPNTMVGGVSDTEWRFPGARNEYSAYRLVRDRSMPVGPSYVKYEPWGGEQWSDLSAWDEGQPVAVGRRFTGRFLAPALRFRFPRPVESTSPDPTDKDYLTQLDAGMAQETDRARTTLAAAPPTATAELAVSFDGLMSYEQMRSLLTGTGARVYWGAVDVWGRGQGPADPQPGHMVGIGFVSPDPTLTAGLPADLEKALPAELTDIAQFAPTLTADLLRTSAAYLRKNGVRYYGAVVEGTPEQLAPIINSPKVSAASLGFVVMPWE